MVLTGDLCICKLLKRKVIWGLRGDVGVQSNGLMFYYLIKAGLLSVFALTVVVLLGTLLASVEYVI